MTTRTQLLYFLKKLHKNPHGVRPICSGSGGPTLWRMISAQNVCIRFFVSFFILLFTFGFVLGFLLRFFILLFTFGFVLGFA